MVMQGVQVVSLPTLGGALYQSYKVGSRLGAHPGHTCQVMPCPSLSSVYIYLAEFS